MASKTAHIVNRSAVVNPAAPPKAKEDSTWELLNELADTETKKNNLEKFRAECRVHNLNKVALVLIGLHAVLRDELNSKSYIHRLMVYIHRLYPADHGFAMAIVRTWFILNSKVKHLHDDEYMDLVMGVGVKDQEAQTIFNKLFDAGSTIHLSKDKMSAMNLYRGLANQQGVVYHAKPRRVPRVSPHSETAYLSASHIAAIKRSEWLNALNDSPVIEAKALDTSKQNVLLVPLTKAYEVTKKKSNRNRAGKKARVYAKTVDALSGDNYTTAFPSLNKKEMPAEWRIARIRLFSRNSVDDIVMPGNQVTSTEFAAAVKQVVGYEITSFDELLDADREPVSFPHDFKDEEYYIQRNVPVIVDDYDGQTNLAVIPYARYVSKEALVKKIPTKLREDSKFSIKINGSVVHYPYTPSKDDHIVINLLIVGGNRRHHNRQPSMMDEFSNILPNITADELMLLLPSTSDYVYHSGLPDDWADGGTVFEDPVFEHIGNELTVSFPQKEGYRDPIFMINFKLPTSDGDHFIRLLHPSSGLPSYATTVCMIRYVMAKTYLRELPNFRIVGPFNAPINENNIYLMWKWADPGVLRKSISAIDQRYLCTINFLIVGGERKKKEKHREEKNEGKKIVRTLEKEMGMLQRLQREMNKMRVADSKNKPKKQPSEKRVIADPINSGPVSCLDHMHNETLKVLHCFINPKTCPAGVKLPTRPPVASFALKQMVSFDMAIGTNGYGWLFLIPTVSNNRDVVQYTTSTFTGTTTGPRANTSVTGMAGTAMVGLPYSEADLTETGGLALNSKMRTRIVGVSVDLSYSGAVIDRSGVAYVLSNPTHQDLSNYTLAQLYSDPHMRKTIITGKKPFKLHLHPVTDVEEQFMDNAQTEGRTAPFFPFSVAGVGTDYYYDYTQAASSSSPGCPAAICIQSEAGNTFTGEVTLHLEYTGTNVGYNATPGYSDLHGYDLVHQITSKYRELGAQAPHLPDSKVLQMATSHVTNQLAPAMHSTIHNAKESAKRHARHLRHEAVLHTRSKARDFFTQVAGDTVADGLSSIMLG